MFTNKRSTSPHAFMLLIAFALLLLVPVVTTVAQTGPVRTSPTQAPTMGAFQANPTQPPKPDPIDDFRANPTPTPRPPRGPDDVVANPTKTPEREIDDLVANPTKTPEREIDDVVANPTKTPEREIDDLVANPVSGTVRVDTRDCPLGVVEDAFLSDYLAICTEAHDGVEFTLEHGGQSDTAVTANGEATWTGVLPGAFEIQETMPDGYGDPIVFCGFTESPGGGVQHPALKPSGGGLVTGVLVQFGAEYVCFWMNIPDEPFVGTGPGSVANPGAGRDDGMLEETQRI